MKTQYYGNSDIGKKRKENQDCYLCDEELGLFAVADGMGGLQYGRETAKEVLRLLQLFVSFEEIEEMDEETVLEFMQNVIQEINEQIASMGNLKGELPLYGATLSGILFWKGSVVVFNVGDSRVYRYHSKEGIQLLTEDDSLLHLIQKAEVIITDEEKKSASHILLQFMGTREILNPAVQIRKGKLDAVYCICSDGLHGMITDWEMESVLKDTESPEQKVRRFIQLANNAGGNDNITAIVVQREG